MAKDDEYVSSEEEEEPVKGEKKAEKRVKIEEEEVELHKAVSSESEEIEAEGEGKGEGEADLVEDGLQLETHGGGELEVVPGYEEAHALTEGFVSEEVEIDEAIEVLAKAGELEYEQPESVCGRDDRVRIRATTRIPWRMICQLFMTFRDGAGSRCTGWFIGPRTVMTAGHCVYSHSHGGWARQIIVIPGMDATHRPFGSEIGRSFRSVRGWTCSGKPDYDYGAIILPSNSLGNRVGWFGFACLSWFSLWRLLINNAGYAGDKQFGTLWFNAGRITKVTSRRLYYMADTAGGHSGSPVWRFRNNQRHAVGVHAYGGCPNKATRITRAVFDNMKMWKALGF